MAPPLPHDKNVIHFHYRLIRFRKSQVVLTKDQWWNNKNDNHNSSTDMTEINDIQNTILEYESNM